LIVFIARIALRFADTIVPIMPYAVGTTDTGARASLS
jgi:hypothetical protein